MAIRTTLALFAAALALSACSSSDDVKYPCPSYGVLKDAGTMTAFAGQGRDVTDMAYRVTLTGTSLKCDYDKQRVEVDLTANLAIERGPAFSSAQVNVPYFVAVTRGKRYVLARQAFAQNFSLTGQQLTGEAAVPIEIPLAENTTGASYEVVIGLALTPEQLAYNRKQASR